jgi:hypothetical protein
VHVKLESYLQLGECQVANAQEPHKMEEIALPGQACRSYKASHVPQPGQSALCKLQPRRSFEEMQFAVVSMGSWQTSKYAPEDSLTLTVMQATVALCWTNPLYKGQTDQMLFQCNHMRLHTTLALHMLHQR